MSDESYVGLMGSIRQAVEAGAVPEPQEGEVAEYCGLCGGDMVYRKSRLGWRIYHACAGPKQRQVEAEELQPPNRTIGEEDGE